MHIGPLVETSFSFFPSLGSYSERFHQEKDNWKRTWMENWLAWKSKGVEGHRQLLVFDEEGLPSSLYRGWKLKPKLKQWILKNVVTTFLLKFASWMRYLFHSRRENQYGSDNFILAPAWLHFEVESNKREARGHQLTRPIPFDVETSGCHPINWKIRQDLNDPPHLEKILKPSPKLFSEEDRY